ncbi:CoA-binding protein [soil metagenome]
MHDTNASAKVKIFKLKNMSTKKTLVIGASENKERYSNLAVRKLLSYNHPVIALGNRAGMIDGTEIITEQKPIEDVDTVTLYLNPLHQKAYYDYILSLNPKRIIFNPGTENEELESMAREKGIKTLEACTLVMLSTTQY